MIKNQLRALRASPYPGQTASIRIFALPPGPKCLVEAQGFKRWTGTLDLQTGQTAVVDATMQVGSVDTVVEVTGAAPVITTESSEIGDVKDAWRIRRCPLTAATSASCSPSRPALKRQETAQTHA